MNIQKTLRRLRLATYVLAATGGVYLLNRYEVIPMPSEGCSPLLSLRPGSMLWVDQMAPGLEVGDVAFFNLPGGGVGIARCARTRSGADGVQSYWLETDVESCPGVDSDDLGWVSARDIQGRLILSMDF